MVDKKVNALLHLANKSEVKRGKLKIFLGFAPGVGKTYAMLNQAQALKKEGLDVAIGLIVTHGRKDTQDLCHDIEVIPLKEVLYREKKFFELDTDAIIKQNPKFVIVDELPHTNIGEARNKKRYTDILEILDAGINVYIVLQISFILLFDCANYDINQNHLAYQE
jgi:two-component system sensor histidine kinase KdpD